MIKWITIKFLTKALKFYEYQCESLSHELGTASYIPEHEVELMSCDLKDYRDKVEHLRYVIDRVLFEYEV